MQTSMSVPNLRRKDGRAVVDDEASPILSRRERIAAIGHLVRIEKPEIYEDHRTPHSASFRAHAKRFDI